MESEDILFLAFKEEISAFRTDSLNSNMYSFAIPESPEHKYLCSFQLSLQIHTQVSSFAKKA